MTVASLLRHCAQCSAPMYSDTNSRHARKCRPCLKANYNRYCASRNGKQIPRRVRIAVIARDGYICRHCGITVRDRTHPYDHAKDTIEIDHLVRVADGGTSTEDNLVVSCLGCNRKRQWERTGADAT